MIIIVVINVYEMDGTGRMLVLNLTPHISREVSRKSLEKVGIDEMTVLNWNLDKFGAKRLNTINCPDMWLNRGCLWISKNIKSGEFSDQKRNNPLLNKTLHNRVSYL
jgi:hypothetical protein